MSRKVFISVLGAGLYGKCKYVDGDFTSQNTFFVQTATLEYLNVKQWSKDDVGLFLLTDFAKKSNWDKTITQRRNNIIQQDIVYRGLEKDIEDLNLPIQIIPVDIPDGNNETEIWEIFSKTFNELKNGDELYFDVTHAFRFLPMLILVLCNYAKFLKGITVKSITYGNYEARNKTVEPNEAPIINLLPLTQLQDWTYAAGQYLDSGNVKKLVELKSIIKSDVLKNIVDKLEIVIKERQTCRGLQIHNSTNLSGLKTTLSEYLSVHTTDKSEEPLHQILKEVDKSLKDFDTQTNFMNGFNAAKWCVKNGLFQQAITMLRENFVTLFCERHGFDIMDKDMRFIVETALNIQINHKQNRKDKWPIDLSDNQIKQIDNVLQDSWIKSDGKHNNALIHVYKEIRDYRNNFNHAGFNLDSPSPIEVENKVTEFVKRTIEIFTKLNSEKLCS